MVEINKINEVTSFVEVLKTLIGIYLKESSKMCLFVLYA